MTQNVNMTNREVCDLIFVDYATKKPFMNKTQTALLYEPRLRKRFHYGTHW